MICDINGKERKLDGPSDFVDRGGSGSDGAMQSPVYRKARLTIPRTGPGREAPAGRRARFAPKRS